jgi:hypothetical protein
MLRPQSRLGSYYFKGFNSYPASLLFRSSRFDGAIDCAANYRSTTMVIFYREGDMRLTHLVLAAAMTIFASEANAWTIYTIMVGDTKNIAQKFMPQLSLPKIGDGVNYSLAQIHDGFLDAAKTEGQVDVQPQPPILGEGFNCDGIWKAIQDLKPKLQSDDVVIFYYAGHGLHVDNAPTQFPYFICGPALKFGPSEIADALETPEDKKPRLIIVLADTCNNRLGAPPLGIQEVIKKRPQDRSKVKDGVQRLFGAAEGKIIISAAGRSESAYFDTSYKINGIEGPSVPGGVFTDLLQNSVDSALLKGLAATWSEIITNATRTMEVSVTGNSPLGDWQYQTPICQWDKEPTICKIP